MYERFTDQARHVMQLANQEAQRFLHEYITPEDILFGLIKAGRFVALCVLENLNVPLDKLTTAVQELVLHGQEPASKPKLPLMPQAKPIIETAIEEAKKLEHNYVGTEHILLGLLRDDESIAAQTLADFGVTYERARVEIIAVLGRNGT